MNWIDLVWAALACLACLIAPGALLGAIVGLRGLWLWGASAPFSLTVIGFASLITPITGSGWSIWAVLVTTAALGVLLAGGRFWLRRWWRPLPDRAPGETWPWVAAFAIAAVILAIRSIQIVGDPANISQTFDNIFHLNAVRFVLDTANASPLHIGSMTSENLWFYPASWHALAALVVDMTGVGVPVAVNAVWIMISTVVWPLSILLLVRTLFGSRPSVLLTAGTVAAGLPAFPFLMIDYGVLYPYHAGLALVPVAVAATIRLLDVGAAGRGGSPVLWGVVLLGSLPGIALLHPGAFVAALALSVPIVIVATARALRRFGARARAWSVVGFTVYAIVGLLMVRVLRPPAEASGWPVVGTAAQAFGEVFALGLYGAEIAVGAAALLIIGIVVATRDHGREHLVALGLFVVAAGLYVVAAGVDNPAIRAEITGPWYNNAPRLAAIVPTTAIPLVALGGGWLWGRVRALADRFARGRGVRRWPATVAAALILVVLGASLQVGPMTVAVRNANFIYSLSDVSPLVSADEMALIRRLPQTVPPDVAIAGSPWTGTSMAYAVADRPVLMPHTLMDTSSSTDVINSELDEADSDVDRLCDAIERENVGFVLDFGGREVHGGTHEYTGLDDLGRSDAVRLVDREGRAKLYEIVACR